MHNGSGARWSVGDTVERELDEDVWIQAVVEASIVTTPRSCDGSPTNGSLPRLRFTVVYSDGSREEGVSGEDLRDPPNLSHITSMPPPQSPPWLAPEDHTEIKSVDDDSDKQSALAFEARVGRHDAFSRPIQSKRQGQEAQYEAVEGLQAASVERIAEECQSEGMEDVLSRSRLVLADGSSLCARVDHAMGVMQRDAIGATASVEAGWQRYRARHDLLADALSEFGRSFTAETWEAFSVAQNSVMTDLMQGVTLPAPRLAISPNNSRQLLSGALQQEKTRRQQQWCEQRQRLRCADRGGPEAFHPCSCTGSQLGCLIWEDTSSLPGRGLHCIGCDSDDAAAIAAAALTGGSGSATVSQPGRESNIDWCTLVRMVCEGRQPQWTSNLEEFVRELHSCCFDTVSQQQLCCRTNRTVAALILLHNSNSVVVCLFRWFRQCLFSGSDNGRIAIGSRHNILTQRWTGCAARRPTFRIDWSTCCPSEGPQLCARSWETSGANNGTVISIRTSLGGTFGGHTIRKCVASLRRHTAHTNRV